MTTDIQSQNKLPKLLRFMAWLTLAVLILIPEITIPLLKPLTKFGQPAIYERGSLLSLTVSHLELVILASFASAVVAITAGVFVTRSYGAEFLPISRSLVNIGQTFPPVAVLAIAVPLLGFGMWPTMVALFIYGLLPIFESTISGLHSISEDTMDAACGMGLTDRQVLWQIELPLALPIILEGIRLSTIINIGTATIGSTVAAKGLGEVIIAGLTTDNTALILQGGLIVALLAMLIYDLTKIAERMIFRKLNLTVRPE